jgi:hypothetical protein
MAPPPKNSMITRTLTQTLTLTLILTLALTLYDQNHILIIKYTNSIDVWVGAQVLERKEKNMNRKHC